MGLGLAQETSITLLLDVKQLLKQLMRDESPYSGYVLLPKAVLRSWVDKQLKLLVTNYLTDVSLTKIVSVGATDYSLPVSSQN